MENNTNDKKPSTGETNGTDNGDGKPKKQKVSSTTRISLTLAFATLVISASANVVQWNMLSVDKYRLELEETQLRCEMEKSNREIKRLKQSEAELAERSARDWLTLYSAFDDVEDRVFLLHFMTKISPYDQVREISQKERQRIKENQELQSRKKSVQERSTQGYSHGFAERELEKVERAERIFIMEDLD